MLWITADLIIHLNTKPHPRNFSYNSVMTAQLRVQLLGKPTLFLDRVVVTGFTSAKVLALMAYLVATGRAHTRDALATLLWPESADDAEAKASLRQALANIRKLGLEPFLHIERDAVGIDPNAALEVDVAQLQRYCAQPIAPEQPLSEVYKGDFLEGFNLKDAPEFDEWALLQREHWREMALAWLARAVALCASQRHYARGAAFAKHMLTLDPWREDAHRALMLFWAKQGQRSAALAQFEQCKASLHKALNAPPSHETLALYERIKLANTLSRSNLPIAADEFIGRKNDIQQLTEQLLKPNIRWVSIVGVGGMGKSRLAIEVSQRLSDEFLNGVFFVGLSSASGLDDVFAMLAQALDLSLNSVKNVRQTLLNYLRDKELLIIFDNVETLLAQPQTPPVLQFFGDLTHTCPLVKCLATSRQRIGLRSENVHLLDGMSYPDPAQPPPDLAALLGYTSAQLFVQKMAQFGVPPATADEVHCIAQICRLVGGMPLGIELAASWVRVLPCHAIASEIERSIDFVASQMGDVPEHQRSIRAVFDSSWARLSQVERAVFARLSLFQGGFSRAAAEHVARANLHTLSSLFDKCFIRRQVNERYDVHDLMRQFARERLDAQPNEQTDTCQRFAQFFMDEVIRLKPKLRSKDQLAAQTYIQQDLYNVRLAWSMLAMQGDLVRLHQAVDPIADYYYVSGLYSDLIDLFGDTIAQLTELEVQPKYQDPLAQSLFGRIYVRLYGHLVYFYFWVANYAEMRRCIQAALKYCDEGDSEGCAFAFIRVGAAYARGVGDPITAKHYLDRGLHLAQVGQFAFELGWAYWGMSLWYYDQGDYDHAVAYAHQCMAVRAEIGDLVNYAKALNQLGNAENFRGNYSHAAQIFGEMIEIMTAAGNVREVSQARYNLGLAQYFLARYAEAYDDFQGMFQYGLRVGDVNNMTLALNGMAMVRNEQGQYAEAIALCQRGIAECDIHDEWYAKVYLQQTLGHAHLQRRELDAAKHAFVVGLTLGLAHGLVPGILHHFLGWGSYFLQLGNAADDLGKAEWLLRQVALHRGSINFSRKRALVLLERFSPPAPHAAISPDADVAALVQLAQTFGLLGE